jgi:hypothetical protein
MGKDECQVNESHGRLRIAKNGHKIDVLSINHHLARMFEIDSDTASDV